MAISLGKAILYFVGDNTGLMSVSEKTMKEVKKRFKNLQKSVVAMGKKMVSSVVRAPLAIAKKVATLGAAAIGGFVAGSVAHFATFGDQLNKIQDRIGATVQGMSELKFIAEQSGIEFNSLTTALQRQTRRLAEAAQGTGEAKDAIKELGLDAAVLKAMKPDQAFMEITKALARVKGQADRVRIAFKLWDTEGVGLVQTLGAGINNIEGLRQRAHELGVVFDEESAAKATKLKDKVNEMWTAFKGVALQIGEIVTPVFTKLAEKFTEIFVQSRQFIEDNKGTLIEWAKKVSDKIESASETVWLWWNAWENKEWIKTMETGMGTLQRWTQAINKPFSALAVSTNKLNYQIAQLVLSKNAVELRNLLMFLASSAIQRGLGYLSASIDLLTISIKTLIDAWAKGKESLSGVLSLAQAGGRMMSGAASGIADVLHQTGALNEQSNVNESGKTETQSQMVNQFTSPAAAPQINQTISADGLTSDRARKVVSEATLDALRLSQAAYGAAMP